MAGEFQEAYKTLEVRCQVLENLANFKDLVALVTRRINGITNFQGFYIFREGAWIVVMVKLKMHDDAWLGFSSDGKEVGSGLGFKPWRLMRCTDVRLEEAPPYPLKKVPEEVIHQIEMRQEASWKRLPGAFPGGEWGALSCGTVLFIVVCRPWGLVFVPTGPTILLCYY